MARYFLKCLDCEDGVLNKKGSQSLLCQEAETFYACHKCGCFWSLSFGENFHLVLRRYNPKMGKTAKEIVGTIADDWEGEPETINIPLETWEDGISSAGGPAGFAEQVRKLIENGNLLYLQDYDGRRTYQIVVHQRTLKLIDLPSNS